MGVLLTFLQKIPEWVVLVDRIMRIKKMYVFFSKSNVTLVAWMLPPYWYYYRYTIKAFAVGPHPSTQSK